MSQSLNPDKMAEVSTLCLNGRDVVLNSNFVLNLIEYVKRLEDVARQADTVALLLKPTCPGEAESLESKIRRAIGVATVVNTCKVQHR
jgi:hypothetical protein